VVAVALKKDDVIAPVGAAHQVRLRSAAHPPYLLGGQQHRVLS